jgi:hypothetical protein
MRVHFELKYGADTLDQARATAYEEVAKFMSVDEAAAPALVDIELKVGIPDPEKDSGLTSHFIVTAYGNVKHSVAKPF